MLRLRLAALALVSMVLLLCGFAPAARAAPPACTEIEVLVPVNAHFLLPEDQCTDPDPGDTIASAAIVGAGPAHGTVLPGTGGYYYTPALDYQGPDQFMYTVTDSHGETSQPATMYIIVDTAPTCENHPVTTQAGQPVTIPFNGLPCDDVDGDDLTFDYDAPPSHGQLTFTADGNAFIYTPDPGYSGPDSFTYYASDPFLDSDDATMSITVTPAPMPTASPTPKATPTPTPTVVPAPRDTTAPTFSVSAAKAKIKRALSAGLKLKVTTNEGATAAVTVTVDRATARKLRLNRKAKGPVTVAAAGGTMTAGTRSLVLKFTAKARKALKKAQRLKLRLKVTLTDDAGNAATRTVNVTLKR